MAKYEVRVRYNPNRHPAGAPNSQGGEFAPSGTGGGTRSPALAPERPKRAPDWPERSGKSVAAYKQHIQDVFSYQEAHAAFQNRKPQKTWNIDTAITMYEKAAKALKAEGYPIDYKVNTTRYTGLLEKGAFGRSIGWGHSETHSDMVIWRTDW
jgi:hypothetical protein